ncbi:MAG: hypothetical protein UR99_C0009G0001, partial [Candidatus Moranbacteria bacterium GW2011_GWD2_36_12]
MHIPKKEHPETKIKGEIKIFIYEEKMRTLIKKYGLQDHIHMSGRITNRQALALHYKIADLFLFPSIYDSSSLVQIEAASQKTPTLFLKDTATASTIKHNINGY